MSWPTMEQRRDEGRKMAKAYNAGASVHEIAKAVGTHAQTVYNRLNLVGCEFRDRGYSKDMLADALEIERLWMRGYSQNEIARKLGRCRKTIKARLDMVGADMTPMPRRKQWENLNSLPRAMKGHGY